MDNEGCCDNDRDPLETCGDDGCKLFGVQNVLETTAPLHSSGVPSGLARLRPHLRPLSERHSPTLPISAPDFREKISSPALISVFEGF